MLHMSCFTKRIKSSNPVMGVVDLSVKLDLAYITIQRPNNTTEQNCKWLLASTSVLCMGPRAHQY